MDFFIGTLFVLFCGIFLIVSVFTAIMFCWFLIYLLLRFTGIAQVESFQEHVRETIGVEGSAKSKSNW